MPSFVDRKDYPVKVKPTAAQRSSIRLRPRRVLPNWNYTILPHTMRLADK
jgi:hypothetical protein